MACYFMKYWIYHTVEPQLGSRMVYSASVQYRRIDIGDVIWFVTLVPKIEHLLLFARLRVDWLGTREDAAQRLSRPSTDLWDAPIYAMTPPEQAETFRLVDLDDQAGRLRFNSAAGRRSLPRFNRAQALQTMRELTPETNAMLEAIWSGC